MTRVKVDTERISPQILRCTHFNGIDMPKGTTFDKRLVTSYEIEYYIRSNGGGMERNGIFYEVNDGCINFRRPGEIVRGVLPYSCYGIYFDLVDTSQRSYKSFQMDQTEVLEENYQNEVLDHIPAFFTPFSGSEYEQLMDMLIKEFSKQNPAATLIAKGLILQILYKMYEDAQHFNMYIANSAHYVTIKKAYQYIRQHFDQHISVTHIANYVQMSTNYFHKIFVESTGITPKKAILKLRLDKSKQLLATTTLSISEVAELCGFNDVIYFDSLFKKNTGQTPREYRKKYLYR